MLDYFLNNRASFWKEELCQ